MARFRPAREELQQDFVAHKPPLIYRRRDKADDARYFPPLVAPQRIAGFVVGLKSRSTRLSLAHGSRRRRADPARANRRTKVAPRNVARQNGCAERLCLGHRPGARNVKSFIVGRAK